MNKHVCQPDISYQKTPSTYSNLFKIRVPLIFARLNFVLSLYRTLKVAEFAK